MLILTFRQSKSKRYKEAIRHALFLGEVKQEDSYNVLELPLKTIIEKWEWFNLLYWIVLDWKSTTVKYDGVEFYSHMDKTRIFYAVQQIHCNWINHTTEKMITSYKMEPIKSKLLDKVPDRLSDEEANRLIEVMRMKEKVNTEHTEFLKRFEGLVKN